MVADLPIAGLCDDLLCHHPGSGWYGSLDARAASNEKGMLEVRTFHLISWVVGIFQPLLYTRNFYIPTSHVWAIFHIRTVGHQGSEPAPAPILRRRLPFLVTMEAQRMLGWMGGTGGCDPKKVLWWKIWVGVWSVGCIMTWLLTCDGFLLYIFV